MSLSRRTFPRAAGVTLALPRLEAFAWAAEAVKLPRRMVCLCAGLGLHAPYFFPEKSGRDYEISPYLDVLKELRGDFTVISGLSHPDVGPTHDSMWSFLTAAPHPEVVAGFRNTISLDQFAADHLGGQTRFAALPLAPMNAGGGFKHGQHLAFNADNNVPLCNLYVSMLQRLGIAVDKFGSITAPRLREPCGDAII